MAKQAQGTAKTKKPNGDEPKSPRSSYVDKAYQEIKDRILQNTMPIGYHATEQELSEILEMSRTPTREALIRLKNEGLVDVRPRRGMRVLPISVADMKEIYEILTALETTAVALVAENGLSEEELAELRGTVDDMEQSLKKEDLVGWAEADKQFHSLLVAFCGNQRIQTLVNQFMDQSHRCRMLTLKLRPRPTGSVSDHAKVVEAISRRDIDTARRTHRQHRERSGKMLIDLLNHLGLTQV